jgi:glycosyltransferase involved in cell wall biosynthesis
MAARRSLAGTDSGLTSTDVVSGVAALSGVRALYVCYLGLEEPLVQTQVLPYLRELVAAGAAMSLLTFEPHLKQMWSPQRIAAVKEQLRADGIDWYPKPYHKRPSLPATLWDIVVGAWFVARIGRRTGLDIIHGRSHVGTAIGVLAKKVISASVLFDFRGFLAEEYVDKQRWKPDGFTFRITKAAERHLLKNADGVVVLSERARQTLFPHEASDPLPVELIPCCTDARRFASSASQDRVALRNSLGIADRLAFVYAGTVGGAYLTKELAAFLGIAREKDHRVLALILTQGSADVLVESLLTAGFSADDIRVLNVAADDVPKFLRAADVGLAPVRPSFSGRASSPTRFAEYLAAGLPVLATAGIGDLDADIQAYRVGVTLDSFDRATCTAALDALERLRRDPDLGNRCQQLRQHRYDLHAVGGPRYRRLYQRLMTRPLRVSAFATYPAEAASTRYRLSQYIQPLAIRGIDVKFEPFLDLRSFRALYVPRKLLLRIPYLALRSIRSIVSSMRALRADVIFVQREAMLFGPPIVERIALIVSRRPLVLDLDDATYISYLSPVYGRLATLLKWPGKTDTLIKWARTVTCGNPNIANYVKARGGEAMVVATALDQNLFHPSGSKRPVPVIGWIGTGATYPFVERLFPIFQELAQRVRFRLVIVLGNPPQVAIPGVDVEVRSWTLAKDAENFRSIDIGVYPMPDDDWTAGKSGLKGVQYMMSGVPSVISPVGVAATLGEPGQTHFLASTDDEWLRALRTLASDDALRARMGQAARNFAERHYAIEAQADRLASIIRAAAR